MGAEGRIKEINAAYECLSDEKKKKTYDLGDKKPFPGFGKFFLYGEPDGHTSGKLSIFT